MTFIPYSQLTIAIASYKETPHDWFPATQVSPFIFDDPGLVWLEHHGRNHGFLPDNSPYEFLDFIADIGHKFEQKWLREMAPGAQVVCFSPTEARDSQKVRLTIELMQRGAPVIYQPALWWAPERIYGAPDLLVHTNWLRDRFPDLVENASSRASATNLGQTGEPGYYVVMDLKFSTGLDQSRKGVDLECYTAQVRIYNFMLGQLQGYMPEYAYLIARDRLADPLPVKMHSSLSGPLDADLASMRDIYAEIKLNGERYRPWVDEIVAINLDHTDDQWRSAKCEIAQDLTPGGDTSLMYYVGQRTKRQLAEFGYPNLKSLLNTDPENIPFEDCKGIGSKTAGQMRAILKPTRAAHPLPRLRCWSPKSDHTSFLSTMNTLRM